MSYLLDTRVFLWVLFDPDRLNKKARQAIENPGNTVYVSAATYWEISLKYALGKLVLTNVLPDALPDISGQMDFETMDIDVDTASTFYKLPRDTHKDPFDRLVVWQAITRNVTPITKDKGYQFLSEAWSQDPLAVMFL
ncbi:MAG: PIN domain protein [Syntrophorhabdus sp. PtaU1.Bin050]|nr:MAG: PIN domain protein [Syntrophorhabdus sp. PtaU1.Bin050]